VQVEWHNGLLKSLNYSGVKCLDWGAETADRLSFFSLTDKPVGCEIKNLREPSHSMSCASRFVEVDMAEGRWNLEITSTIDSNRIVVSQTLTCQDTSIFQDFVMRFKFKKDSFEYGEIGGVRIPHKNSNKWYQYPVNKVSLNGVSGAVKISVLSAQTQNKFTQEMYIRDERDYWIVHARLMPIEPCDYYWIKWSNRFFTLSLSDRLSRILISLPKLKHLLWYMSERRGGRPQLQAQGLSKLTAGQTLQLTAEVKFD